MSEPAIPARYAAIETSSSPVMSRSTGIAIIYELGAAEAKVAELERERSAWQSDHEETCPNKKWRLKVAEQATTIAELIRQRDTHASNAVSMMAQIERLTGYLNYMAMGFVPPDRCKSYAATALKNPSEPK